DNGKLIEDRVLEIYDFNKKVSMINSIIKRIINHYTAQLKKDDSNQTLIHDKKKQAQQFKNVTKKLNWEVVWPRNVLAHVKHDTDGAGSTYLKSKLKNPDGKIETIKIDSDWYKNTRKDLRKHLGNLENVAEFIKEWHNIE
ncbi:hypothetical protein KAR91_86385, partial [Candidatus Pacearchaeota archaeon]|nr:hypothetical protein [Candidatus Pacearchaeota archaeon]